MTDVTFYTHPILGARLEECMQLLLDVDVLFETVLDKYYDGVPDLKALTALWS